MRVRPFRLHRATMSRRPATAACPTTPPRPPAASADTASCGAPLRKSSRLTTRGRCSCSWRGCHWRPSWPTRRGGPAGRAGRGDRRLERLDVAGGAAAGAAEAPSSCGAPAAASGGCWPERAPGPCCGVYGPRRRGRGAGAELPPIPGTRGACLAGALDAVGQRALHRWAAGLNALRERYERLPSAPLRVLRDAQLQALAQALGCTAALAKSPAEVSAMSHERRLGARSSTPLSPTAPTPCARCCTTCARTPGSSAMPASSRAWPRSAAGPAR